MTWHLIPTNKHKNVSPFEQWQREVDRAFDHIFSNPFIADDYWPMQADSSFRAPAVNVTQTKDAFEVTAELPGMSIKDLDVTLEGNTLTLKAAHSEAVEEKEQDFIRKERAMCSFYRRIPLPSEVDENKVDAFFKDGVLTIKIAKSAKIADSHKKVEIKNG